ncbi:MAG: hypothetical protein NWT02_11295 [Opitutales bacterium]|nr:hypothetical protein [Opitutales bacterium]
MKLLQKTSALFLASAMLLTALTGCGTTRSENGVIIEKNRSYNPLNYIPW